jgi:transposase
VKRCEGTHYTVCSEPVYNARRVRCPKCSAKWTAERVRLNNNAKRGATKAASFLEALAAAPALPLPTEREERIAYYAKRAAAGLPLWSRCPLRERGREAS